MPRDGRCRLVGRPRHPRDETPLDDLAAHRTGGVGPHRRRCQELVAVHAPRHAVIPTRRLLEPRFPARPGSTPRPAGRSEADGRRVGMSVQDDLRVSGDDAGACLALTVDARPGAEAPSDTQSASAATVTGDAMHGTPLVLADVEMGVTAELGRCHMTVRELLSLTPGAIIDLDRSAGAL